MIRTFFRSFLIYVTVFLITLCIINIDKVCSEGYGAEGSLVPVFVKGDDGHVSLGFGQ